MIHHVHTDRDHCLDERAKHPPPCVDTWTYLGVSIVSIKHSDARAGLKDFSADWIRTDCDGRCGQ